MNEVEDGGQPPPRFVRTKGLPMQKRGRSGSDIDLKRDQPAVYSRRTDTREFLKSSTPKKRSRCDVRMAELQTSGGRLLIIGLLTVTGQAPSISSR